MPVTAEQLERGRDLAAQSDALKGESKQDVLFVDMTPRPAPITLYAMKDGEPVEMSPDLAQMAMRKRYTDGTYVFTADKSKAPAYVLGNVKCILHPDSAERELLNDIGMSNKVCRSEHLASLYSKRIHAQRRHKDEWAAFVEYRDTLKEQAAIDRQERQLEATLALAGTAAKKGKAAAE